mgnify:CR=1 FL=1
MRLKIINQSRYQRGPIGGIRYGGTSSISANVGQGMGTIATPDGRNAFEPLAEAVALLIMQIKTALLLFSKLFPSFQQKKLPAAFFLIRK